MIKVKIAVREARSSDLDTINELTDTMHNYLAGLYGLELSSEELEEEHFDEDELMNTWVAEAEGDGVIGYMSFSRGSNEWSGPNYELEHIVMDERYRGLGVGRKLFDVLLEMAEKDGVNIITGTLARNETALRFYEELGFRVLSKGLLLDLQKRIFTD